MKTKIFIYQKVILAFVVMLFFSCNNNGLIVKAQETDNYTDQRDGKTYKTVKIGEQWIMAENFAYKPEQGNYWTYGDDTSNILKYGYLYDWETAKKVAPEGWHLPSLEEWKTLRKSLGGKRDVFKYLGGTMEIVFKQMVIKEGFNAKFAGDIRDNGQFGNINLRTDFWSSTNGGENGPYYYRVDCRDSTAYLGSVDFPKSGKSVRFFKDLPKNINEHKK